jgi:hypothetical protein
VGFTRVAQFLPGWLCSWDAACAVLCDSAGAVPELLLQHPRIFEYKVSTAVANTGHSASQHRPAATVVVVLACSWLSNAACRSQAVCSAAGQNFCNVVAHKNMQLAA